MSAALAERMPTTREELAYKTVETLEDLLGQEEAGKISKDQLSCAIQALLAAVGWALDKDTFQLLSDIDIETLEPAKERHILMDNFHDMVLIERKLGEDVAIIHKEYKTADGEWDDPVTVRLGVNPQNAMKSLLNKFKIKGFREL